MWKALLAGGCLALLVANALAFAALVPLRPGAGAHYVLQMAGAVLLAPAVVVGGMLSRRRFRNAGSVLRGLLAGLGLSLAATAASVSLSPPPPGFAPWDAEAKRAHLRERCRARCGADARACREMCACTVEALFATHADEDLQRITAEGPFGQLSREANRLLGEFAAECGAARVGNAGPADTSPAS